MTIDNFISNYNIKQADAIVINKAFLGLLDHYIIYLGKENDNEHLFIANYSKGVKILYEKDIMEFSNYMTPVRIKKFVGNENQRNVAVERALFMKDRFSYDLILNNCEHFSNYVQTGVPYSQQTQVLGTGLTLAGLTTIVSSEKDSNEQYIGIGLLTLGLITILLNNEK